MTIVSPTGSSPGSKRISTARVPSTATLRFSSMSIRLTKRPRSSSTDWIRKISGWSPMTLNEPTSPPRRTVAPPRQPPRCRRGETTSASGISRRSARVSSSVNCTGRPASSPAKGFEVRIVQTKRLLVAVPENPASHATLETASRAEQQHEQEDPPEDAESGEEGAQAVLRQRDADLLPVVEVEHRPLPAYSSRSASTGRTAAARRAGKKPATAPATTSSTVAHGDPEVDVRIAEELDSSGSRPATVSSTTTPSDQPK
jgi:hypothetical protein